VNRSGDRIHVRRARPDEVIDVRHRVLRRGRHRDTAVFPGDDAPDARHWVAERDGQVVAVVTVITSAMPHPAAGVPGPPGLQLRGMAVVDEERGTGVGALLLDVVHTEIAAPMWCNARVAVVGFYTRHGWVAVGSEFDIPLVGPHQRMWWAPTHQR
jgi:GNAT superfamily N-acetyltransferase